MIKNLYCNGCSTMCGGGLEIVKPDLLEYYKTNYGVTWETERDIMWPKLVADGLNLKIHDYSKSGAGIERYIRETYDYIYEDFKRAEETIFHIIQIFLYFFLNFIAKLNPPKTSLYTYDIR